MNLFTRIAAMLSGKRSLEANRPIARWRNDTRQRFSTTESLATLNARAEHFALNNPHGAKIVQTLVQNIIGTGIIPRSVHTSKPIKEKLRTAWAAFVDRVDDEGNVDFYGYQQAVARDMVIYGEHFSSIGADERTGEPRLTRLNSDQIDRSLNSTLADGFIIQGIEFSRRGKRRAYHVRSASPHELAGGLSGYQTRRIPASEIIHVFRPLVPGQVRGISWLAPILIPATELDALLDALLVRTKIAAMFVGSITDSNGAGPGIDGTANGTVLDTQAEPGTIRIEEPGKELRWSEPPDTGDAPTLATETLRMMAVGAGVTYEQLTGDYSKVNYSSARAAILEFRRFAEGIQHHTISFQFNRPVWRVFIRFQVLKGTIPATAYMADRDSFDTAKWLPPAWAWVDPLKDIIAAVVAMKNRLRSRSDIVAEQGFDVEDLDAEIAADKFLEGAIASAV